MDTLEPLDNLTKECIEVLRKNGSSSTKVSQVSLNKDKVAFKLIENGNEQINLHNIREINNLNLFLYFN